MGGSAAKTASLDSVAAGPPRGSPPTCRKPAAVTHSPAAADPCWLQVLHAPTRPAVIAHTQLFGAVMARALDEPVAVIQVREGVSETRHTLQR